MTLTERDEAQFWARVALPDANGCMLWLGYVRTNGYGQFGRCSPAHRVAYELAYGPIGSDLQVDHLCRIRHCVAPLHLEAVTQQENIKRGDAGLHQRIKTHCKQGHPYDEANTYMRRRGGRTCRACNRESYHRRKAAA